MNKRQKLIEKSQQFRESFIQWAKWRWEFMRRNPEYIADYRKTLKLQAQAKHPPGSIEKKGNLIKDLYIETPEYWEDIEIRKKYNEFFGSTMPLTDPDLSFDKAFSDNAKRFLWRTWTSILGHDKALRGPYFRWTDYDNGDDPDRSKVHIEIDFKRVNSIKALKDLLCQKIDEHVETYNSMSYFKNRINMTDGSYEIILLAGDMKFNSDDDKTNEQIAKELFPRDFKNDNKNAKPESAIRKVSDYIRRYEQLVFQRGYKTITYP